MKETRKILAKKYNLEQLETMIPDEKEVIKMIYKDSGTGKDIFIKGL